MKIIKAVIKKHRTEEATSFNYPNGWDATKINVLAYEDSDNMGDVEEFCIGLIHDDEYTKQLLNSSDQVEEIDENIANELGNKYKPQRPIVDDDVLPELLLAISKPPDERTKHERDILNPDSDVKGIRKSPKFDIKRWYSE